MLKELLPFVKSEALSMKQTEWCVIANPNAGSLDEMTALRDALRRLGSHQTVETSAPGDAERAAEEAAKAGIPKIVAAGGDGTLNEVVNGLKDRREDVVVGIIPVGTGNDFARELGIEPGYEQAIDFLLQGATRSVDLLRLRNRDLSRLFVNTSAGGFTTIVDDKLTAESKDWLGALAFYVAGARALPELTEYRMTLKFDQNEPFEVNAYNVVVSNGSTIAGGIPVAPEASLDDGLMDILVIPSIPLAKLALTLPLVLTGRHVGNTDLIIQKARNFRVSSTPNFALNTDGEVIGEAPALYDVLPKGLKVIANPAVLGTGQDKFV